jgi:ABC-type Fe3+-hydroxamate transport system substrate-binding protein
MSKIMLGVLLLGSMLAQAAAPVTENTPAAQRIVALAPHITELLFAAGAGNQIVGTVAYSDYPAAAKEILRIGDYNSVQLESIIRLKPDLIIAWPGKALTAQLQKLEKLGFKVLYSDPTTPQQVADNIRWFGQLTGHTEYAAQQAADFLQHWQAIAQQHAGLHPIKVFYQVWSDPLMSLNKDSVIHHAISVCGGINIFADAPVPVPQVNIEAVVRDNPDVIISAGETASAASMQQWRKWQNMTATRFNQFYVISGDDISRPTPGILVGVEKLCGFLEQARAKIYAH